MKILRNILDLLLTIYIYIYIHICIYVYIYIMWWILIINLAETGFLPLEIEGSYSKALVHNIFSPMRMGNSAGLRVHQTNCVGNFCLENETEAKTINVWQLILCGVVISFRHTLSLNITCDVDSVLRWLLDFNNALLCKKLHYVSRSDIASFVKYNDSLENIWFDIVWLRNTEISP